MRCHSVTCDKRCRVRTQPDHCLGDFLGLGIDDAFDYRCLNDHVVPVLLRTISGQGQASGYAGVVKRSIELAVRFDCFTDQILNINCLGDMCFDKRCLPGSVANRANGFFSTIHVNSATITLAPCWANTSAVALPMPEPRLVTRATLPLHVSAIRPPSASVGWY